MMGKMNQAHDKLTAARRGAVHWLTGRNRADRLAREAELAHLAEDIVSSEEFWEGVERKRQRLRRALQEHLEGERVPDFGKPGREPPAVL